MAFEVARLAVELATALFDDEFELVFWCPC